MKKLINDPRNVVSEMSEGFVAMHGGLTLLPQLNVVLRADVQSAGASKVAIISGGGSGHEPAHAGYVGEGMLSAAVAGEVFTSPSVDSVLAAIRAVSGKPGVLLIVKNYTGDRLNFGLAAEMARAGGIPVAMVIVGDDIALAGSQDYAGARGIAGTVLVHKVAGAVAAEGLALADVERAASDTAKAVATMGAALSSGIVPAAGKPSFVLAENEMELGLGIHGEPGVRRAQLPSADELASDLVERIVSVHKLQHGERVAVMINNLGSTTFMELAIFGRAALQAMSHKGLAVERVYSGAFMTSLEAAGVSLSILRVDDERLKRLDAPTLAPAWPNAAGFRPTKLSASVPDPPVAAGVLTTTSTSTPASAQTIRAVKAACRALLHEEANLTTLDLETGDGDLGFNMSRGAKAAEELLEADHRLSVVDLLRSIATTLQRVVGGTSGPLYGVLFFRTANALAGSKDMDGHSWAQAVLQGCSAVSELGGAKEGDRTMLDALLPFAKELARAVEEQGSSLQALEKAVAAAEKGAFATASMAPKRGRSSYLGNRVLGHPDAGAVAVTVWLRATLESLRSR